MIPLASVGNFGPLAIGAVAVLATLAGGAGALRFQHRLGSLLGFSSGAVIGVALLDLLPEAIELAGPRQTLLASMSYVAFGVFGYQLLDWLLSREGIGKIGHRRHLGPASLALHSVLDGVGIGVGFQVSPTVGLTVASAVLAHDVLDGANTVGLSLAGGIGMSGARRWLLLDAAAPLVGIVIAGVVGAAGGVSPSLLAFFAGGFLYVGASELLPRSRERSNTLVQVASVGLGLALIYAVMRLSEG